MKYLRLTQASCRIDTMSSRKRMIISEQLRQAILNSDVSRYRISRECGIGEAQLSRFANGKGSLSLPVVDRICKYLGLELTDSRATPRKESKTDG